MSAGAIDELMQNWAAREGAPDPPFADHKDLSWPHSVAVLRVYICDPRLILRRQLANPDFKDDMDFAAKRVYAADGTREYMDFMSGNWAWRHSLITTMDLIAKIPGCKGTTFVPAILSSDKTTVSVATGQDEYYPLYISNGLIHNNIRHAHGDSVTLIGFLTIPKISTKFRTFRRNLFHGSVRRILQSLLPGMMQPEVALFGDGHYRHVVYGLGPYIADYPEQVLLACVVQGWSAQPQTKISMGRAAVAPSAHSRRFFDTFSHKKLWDDYGIILDVLPFTWHQEKRNLTIGGNWRQLSAIGGLWTIIKLWKS
ncbi:hypothetical protein MVEN_02643500 [Mycena venus]|uniref:Uncharacterized protein n=1 Tax=Mycena venus TaxID=2733690 RepID=A0A8H6TSB9_9AGAR|nr:hypothetical protein MVEN_02643500 [Mycena venus]